MVLGGHIPWGGGARAGLLSRQCPCWFARRVVDSISDLAGYCAVDPADEDAAYDAMLAERLALKGDSDDLAGIISDGWTDDEEIESALNDVDVFNMLVAAMNSMKSNEPERFQVCHPSRHAPPPPVAHHAEQVNVRRSKSYILHTLNVCGVAAGDDGERGGRGEEEHARSGKLCAYPQCGPSAQRNTQLVTAMMRQEIIDPILSAS